MKTWRTSAFCELNHCLLSCLGNSPRLSGCRGQVGNWNPSVTRIQRWWCWPKNLFSPSRSVPPAHLFSSRLKYKRRWIQTWKEPSICGAAGRWRWRWEAGAHCCLNGRGNTCLAWEGASRSLKGLLVKRTMSKVLLLKKSPKTRKAFALPLSPKLRPPLLHLLKLPLCWSLQSSQRCPRSCRVPAPDSLSGRNYICINMDFFTCHACKWREIGASCCRWAAVITLRVRKSDRMNDGAVCLAI